MHRLLQCLLLEACFVSVAFAGAPGYVAVPLGSLGAASTYGTGVSANGQVSGFADTDATGAAHRHAFLFDGTIHDLGTLSGGAQSFAYGINDTGQVAGASALAGVAGQHAFVSTGGTLRDLNPVLGGPTSQAFAINSAGDIAGASGPLGLTRAYLFRAASNTVTDLGTLGGSLSQGLAINEFDHVTGFAHVPSSDAHAFRYDANGMVDLGTLGGRVSLGHGINAADHVVGEAFLVGDTGPHAFFHDGGGMADLGTLGGSLSRALAINSSDTVVGEATDTTGALHAFVYAAGHMVDLNAITTGLDGAVLTTATAINEAGQIVAMSCTSPPACSRAFRLDPVPEPKVAAVEYHHAGFDHYFITAIPDEIMKLDNGTFAGWTRTGDSFNVYAADQVGTNPVCRFFSTAFAPKSSHFYTPFAGECAIVQRKPEWSFEGRVFNIAVPDAGGACPAGTQPVYRLYNNGVGEAPNHRYTTSLATRATMIAQGWIPEGIGPDAVEMCAPL